MTLVIGMHLSEFVLLAADTRTTRGYPGEVVDVDDDTCKILKTPIGLITGAGYVTLLDAVKERLMDEPIDRTEDIEGIIAEERQVVADELDDNARLRSEGLDYTSWMFTYLGADRRDDPEPSLRLAIYHPSLHESRRLLIPENRGAVVAPRSMSQDQASLLDEQLNDRLVTLEKQPDQRENFRLNVGVIAEFMADIAKQHDDVAHTFHVGMHFRDGSRGITTMIGRDAEPIAWQDT